MAVSGLLSLCVASARAEDGALACLQQFSCEWHSACRLPCLDAAPTGQVVEDAAPQPAGNAPASKPRKIAAVQISSPGSTAHGSRPRVVGTQHSPASSHLVDGPPATAPTQLALRTPVSPSEAFAGSHQAGPSEKIGAVAYDEDSLPTKKRPNPFGVLK